jgi:U5 small nuclear ribonucleoprotein component
LQEGVTITLVVNKIDRLILELRLPPTDAYYKIKHTIEEINTFIRSYSSTSLCFQISELSCSSIDPNPDLRLSPEKGNVAFASTDMNWCFTLRSFAHLYAETYGKTFWHASWNSSLTTYSGKVDAKGFADRLWGDIYFDDKSRKFTRKQADPSSPRSFVHFVLNPLYKLYSQVLSEETDSLKATMAELGIKLKPVMYKMDVRPLLKAILDQFFGPATGLVDLIVEHIPSPVANSARKVGFLCFLYGPLN